MFLLLLLNTFLYAECELSQTDRERKGEEGGVGVAAPYPFDAVDISPKNTKPKWQMALPSSGVLNLKCA